jgi:Pseudouridylate synthases, 23S RNA-specific
MNYLVNEQHSGERIDKFLVGVMENVSRTDVQKLIAAGEVKVGGAAVSKISVWNRAWSWWWSAFSRGRQGHTRG